MGVPWDCGIVLFLFVVSCNALAVNITALLPVSDDAAHIGVQLRKSAQLAVSAVIASATLPPGVRLQLLVQDTADDPAQAASRAYESVQVCVCVFQFSAMLFLNPSILLIGP